MVGSGSFLVIQSPSNVGWGFVGLLVFTIIVVIILIHHDLRRR